MTDTCRDLLDQVEPKDLTQIALQMLFTIERMGLIIPEITDTIRKALEQAHPAIHPVPVAERPWEREGWCDAEGMCWWGHPSDDQTNAGWVPGTWEDVEMVGLDSFTISLPHHALPTPEANP
jgi:hypothetical protein